jgi:hypothetical protein
VVHEAWKPGEPPTEVVNVVNWQGVKAPPGGQSCGRGCRAWLVTGGPGLGSCELDEGRRWASLAALCLWAMTGEWVNHGRRRSGRPQD